VEAVRCAFVALYLLLLGIYRICSFRDARALLSPCRAGGATETAITALIMILGALRGFGVEQMTAEVKLFDFACRNTNHSLGNQLSKAARDCMTSVGSTLN
jgi:hypothetical protein